MHAYKLTCHFSDVGLGNNLFLGKYNTYMGITCNMPVYIPVDQKQSALREDKYMEMLSSFAFTTPAVTKLLLVANEF